MHFNLIISGSWRLGALLLPLASLGQNGLAPSESAPLTPVFTVRLNALGFANKARGQAEATLGPVGVGVVGSYYYAGSFTGTKAEAYVRYYTGRRLAEGFYAQAKGSVGRYRCHPLYNRTVATYDAQGFLRNLIIDPNYDPGPQSFVAAGGGGGVGYQFRLGPSRRVVIDFYAGLQFVPLPEGLDSRSTTVRDAGGGRTETDLESHDLDPAEWYGIGPGSVLNSMISIGYTFGGSRTGAVPFPRRSRELPAPEAPSAPPIRRTAVPGPPRPWTGR